MTPRRLIVPALVMVLSACSDDDPTDSSGMIELSVTPGAISVSQGTNGSVNVSLTRSSGFTNPVTLTVAGLPAGITATVTPAELVGASATAVITTTVANTAAPGAYTATVRATADGAGEASVVYQLTVTPLGTIQYLFCSPASVPVFAASQDGNGAWQRVTGTDTPQGARFNVTLTQSRGGVLFVYEDGGPIRPAPRLGAAYVDQLVSTHRGAAAPHQRSLKVDGYLTEVLFGTTAELAADATLNCQFTQPTRTAEATVSGVPAGSYGWVAIGGVVYIFDGAVPVNPVTFSEVPQGLVDVVGARAVPGQAPDKVILIRNLDSELAASPVAVDFNSSATITPATATSTITGAGGDLLEVYTDLVLSNGLTGLWSDLAPSLTTVRPWSGLPRSVMHPNEYHSLVVFSSPEDSPDFRVFVRYLADVANQTVALGPQMPDLSTSTVEQGAYPRFRFQGGIPAEYDKGVAIEVAGEGNGLTIFTSAAWLAAGGSAASYDLVMPDVDGLNGFPSAARLSAGDNTVAVTGFWFNSPGVFDPRPTLGKEYKAALRNFTISVP